MNLTFDESTIRDLVKPIAAELVASVISNPIGGADRLAYTEPEAATLLGIPTHALRDARLRGELVSTKLGGRIGYERTELIAYLAGGREA